MKKLCAMLLSLALLCALLPAQAGAYRLGDTIADFSVSTPDGETLSLQALLQKYRAVVLNFWFKDCTWCDYEFPYLEEAYQQLSSDVAVLALSPYDDAQTIADYQTSKGLTFPMAMDTAGLSTQFGVGSYPTTIVIDRYGVYCLREEGAQPSAQAFIDLLTPYIGADYSQSVLNGASLPTAQAPSAEALRGALGNALTFYSSDSLTAWPWLVDGDRVYSSNAGAAETDALLYTRVTAQAGDALAFDVRVSCLPVFDRLTISLNGEIVKTFTGETSLQGYAIAFPQAGEYEICFSFAKESAEGAGDDRAELSHIRLLHGQEAADALAANPAYPQTLPGKELDVSLDSSAAREIAFDDPAGYIAAYLPAKHYYILTQDPAPAHVAIGADIDPDAAILYNMDGARAVSTAETGESGFIVSCGLQDESYDQLLVLESLEQQENNAAILYFADTAFVDQVCQGFGASWRYLENDAADSAQESPQEATYTLRFVDADGAPVAGVMVNICSDTFCFAPAVTGTDGVATFTGAPYAYEVHVLHAPTGYQWDDAQTITLPAAGGEVVLSLSKE